jgi:transposase
MAGRNKTDKFDARGLALELLIGTLPAIWIPPADVRDLRGLMRNRLALRAQRTQVRNRVSAAINRYGLKKPNEDRDLFAQRCRRCLGRYLQSLPAATQAATKQELALLDEINTHVQELEKQIDKQVVPMKEMRLLRTVPGIGRILGATILLEVGDVDRFPSAGH